MIYFDNAATTRPNTDCLAAASEYLTKKFYNPSALYAEGYNLHLEIEEDKRSILTHIADPDVYSLIVTSCGTEADNQAVFCCGRRGNIVTTMGEHAAVYAAVQEAGRSGIETRFASLNSDGSVNVESLLSLVDEKTSLVSVIHVNNETGAVNDIAALSAAVKRRNARTLFHSDGVQAYGKIAYRLSENVDLYSVSAHKIGALKGTGALIKKKKLIIRPFIFGGGQEAGLRSGTENVFGIKMFALAAQKAYSGLNDKCKIIAGVCERLWELLDKELFTKISPDNGSPYILTVAAKGVRGETILHMCDDRGLIIGTGSACSSNASKRHSRVMQACGLDSLLADGVLRISFCSSDTIAEAEEAADILNSVVREDRENTK